MRNVSASDETEPTQTCPPGKRREELDKQGPGPELQGPTAKTNSSPSSPGLAAVLVMVLSLFCFDSLFPDTEMTFA